MEDKTKAIPILGTFSLIKRVFKIKRNLLEQIEQLHSELGEEFAIKQNGLKCFIKDPEIVKQILITDHMKFEKGKSFNLFRNLIGAGLLTSDGAKWKKERTVLNTEFMRQNEQKSFDIIQEELFKAFQNWESQKEINFTRQINILTMKTICRIMFNFTIGDTDLKEVREAFEDYDSFFTRQQRALVKLPFWFPLPYITKARKAKKRLRDFATKILNEKKNEQGNMINRMLEAGFSKEGILDHILTFFIAGHETTANSINFTLLLTMQNQDVLTKLKAEISQHKGLKSWEDLKELEYLDSVIKESLRLFPTIPLFPREAIEDIKIGPYPISKGDMVAFSPWIIHRCEKKWDNALEFDPQRFIGKNFEKEFIYFPFSLGPRKCIGARMSTLQIKVILFRLFENYNFKIDQNDGVKFVHKVSLAPAEDIYLSDLEKIF